MQASIRSKGRLCPNNTLGRKTVLVLLRDSRRANVPRREQVKAHIVLVRSAAEAAHEAADAVLGCAVHGRARLVAVSGDAGHHDDAAVVVFVIRLTSKVVHSKLGRVHAADEARLDDAQVRLEGFLVLSAV